MLKTVNSHQNAFQAAFTTWKTSNLRGWRRRWSGRGMRIWSPIGEGFMGCSPCHETWRFRFFGFLFFFYMFCFCFQRSFDSSMILWFHSFWKYEFMMTSWLLMDDLWWRNADDDDNGDDDDDDDDDDEEEEEEEEEEKEEKTPCWQYYGLLPEQSAATTQSITAWKFLLSPWGGYFSRRRFGKRCVTRYPSKQQENYLPILPIWNSFLGFS